MESEQRKRKRVEPTVQGLSQPGHDKQNEEPPVVSAVYYSYYGGWCLVGGTQKSVMKC